MVHNPCDRGLAQAYRAGLDVVSVTGGGITMNRDKQYESKFTHPDQRISQGDIIQRVPVRVALVALAMVLLVACIVWGLKSSATIKPTSVIAVSTLEAHAPVEVLIRVCSACDTSTIQAAIEIASPGTVIQVAEGTYLERLVLTKSLTLEGGWNVGFDQRDINAQRTVIDGQRLGTVISISNASPIIDGFWITGGNSPQGGGIWIADARSIIRNNVISENLASLGVNDGWGGGIYADGNSTVVLLDANVIASNTAHLGGGVLVNGTAKLTMTNNIIVSNIADQGGGVYAYPPGVAHIANNTFVQNFPSALTAQGNILIVANNIIISHVVGISSTTGAVLSPMYNLFYANGQNYASTLSAVTPSSDLVADPLFASNYHLSLSSPAIDRGVAWAAPPYDIDGQSRPIGQVDIGADEAGTTTHMPDILKQDRSPVRECPFGVGIWPPKEIPSQIGQAHDLGVCWVRVNVDWDRIEPVKTTPRTYDWQTTDSRILSVTLAGINPIALVGANPPWASAYPGGPVTDTQDILDFLTAAAERYDGDGFLDAPGSPVVKVWELYNEPDNRSVFYANYRGWGYWGERGEEYAQFLAQARATLKSADPTALVAFGGLAHESIKGDVFDLTFPDVVFGYIHAHPGDYFDFFNFHFFPAFGEVYSAWGPDIVGKAEYFRDLMDQHEVGWPIIVTEAGYWSSSYCGGPWAGNYEDQARYVVQLYSRSAAADIKSVSWLLLFDLPVHDADRGLSGVQGVPKPSYNAYKMMVDKLGDLHFERVLSPTELGTQSAEGYAFNNLSDSHYVYVVWMTDSQVTSTLRVAAPSVVVSDKVSSQWPMSPTIPYFEPYAVADGDDGVQDGYAEVVFGSSPVYVEVSP